MSNSINTRIKRMYRKFLASNTTLLASSPGSLALSVLYSLKRRSYNRFYRDGDGMWVSRQSSHTVFSPTIRLVDQIEVRRDVFDQWLHRYTPQPGDVVVDIGAGIGEETIYFSRMVGPAGKVISIEAHPETFACLQKTIRINNLSNVSALHCAVSDAAGEVIISDDTIHIQNSIIGAKVGTAVASSTLDSILEPLGLAAIDFLKMNIEGAEKLAIRGMGRTVRHTKNLCISCHDFLGRPMQTRKEVVEYLTQQGFEIFYRPSDPRPWVRDYLYAANKNVPG